MTIILQLYLNGSFYKDKTVIIPDINLPVKARNEVLGRYIREETAAFKQQYCAAITGNSYQVFALIESKATALSHKEYIKEHFERQTIEEIEEATGLTRTRVLQIYKEIGIELPKDMHRRPRGSVKQFRETPEKTKIIHPKGVYSNTQWNEY